VEVIGLPWLQGYPGEVFEGLHIVRLFRVEHGAGGILLPPYLVMGRCPMLVN
jgi:hypothetical protein